MHELQEQLELVFNTKISAMNVSYRNNAEPIYSGHGHVHSHVVSAPTITVAMSVVAHETLLLDPIHAFGFTDCAKVTQVQQQQYQRHPRSVYIIEFVVIDIDNFTKDLNKYCWERFDKSFTKQLDKILVEE